MNISITQYMKVEREVMHLHIHMSQAGKLLEFDY